MAENALENAAELFIPFRFQVSFSQPVVPARTGKEQTDGDSGATEKQAATNAYFSEISGLEMNTSPKTLKEGGRNWGQVQLSAPVSFPNLVLKRGFTRADDLWAWYRFIYQSGHYAFRADCTIAVKENTVDNGGNDRIRMTWTARNCLPVKFKGSDLSGTASNVAIEELHLAHEGLELEWVNEPPATESPSGADDAA